MSTRKPMSPVNIEQNREVGIDTPLAVSYTHLTLPTTPYV